MTLRMFETLILIATKTKPNKSGVASLAEERTRVYADKLAVKRSEHYAAEAAGQKVDIIFRVNADEYGGQALLEYDGTKYRVTRTYPSGRCWVELICRRA